jgi:drug/metabolite transporter (DMT)-like permease
MSKELIFSGIYLLSVFVSSVSQILLKKSAQENHKNKLAEYLDIRVIVAYGMFFGATLITVTALKVIPVSMGTVLESAGYIFVTILGMIFLKEKVSKRKWRGLLIIVAGILIYAL